MKSSTPAADARAWNENSRKGAKAQRKRRGGLIFESEYFASLRLCARTSNPNPENRNQWNRRKRKIGVSVQILTDEPVDVDAILIGNDFSTVQLRCGLLALPMGLVFRRDKW